MVKHDVFGVFSQRFPRTRFWVLGTCRVLGVSVCFHMKVLGSISKANAHTHTKQQHKISCFWGWKILRSGSQFANIVKKKKTVKSAGKKPLNMGSFQQSCPHSLKKLIWVPPPQGLTLIYPTLLILFLLEQWDTHFFWHQPHEYNLHIIYISVFLFVLR